MLMRGSEFSYGFLNPLVGFAMSFLGAFLGLRCTTRARAYRGWVRARWLLLAGESLGFGVWLGHFIDMLGFAVPGETIRYSVPETLASALLAVVVMWGGLFITGYSARARWLALGGLLVGLGIASVHYTGMAAMRMPGAVSYDPAWLLVSSAVAIAGGVAALWSVLRLRGIWPTIGASLITAAAIGGMHYAGMAAMRMTGQPMAMAAPGATAEGFLLPAVVVIGTLIFLIAFAVALAPTEDEIREDAALQARITEIGRQSCERVTVLHRADLHPIPDTGQARNPLLTSASGAVIADSTGPSANSRRQQARRRVGGAIFSRLAAPQDATAYPCRRVPEWVLQPPATTLMRSRG
jgi:NO-binding membrane sensor protein with MHYT domain